MRSPRILVFVTVIALASACAGSEGADPTDVPDPPATASSVVTSTTRAAGGTEPSELPDPCQLLTPSDLEAIAGFTFMDGEADEFRTGAGEATCEWQSLDSTEQFGVVQLVVSSLGYDFMKDAASNVYDLVDVEVAGADRGFSDVEGSPVGAEANGLYLQVTYTGSDQDTIGASTVALAEIAIGNLP